MLQQRVVRKKKDDDSVRRPMRCIRVIKDVLAKANFEHPPARDKTHASTNGSKRLWNLKIQRLPHYYYVFYSYFLQPSHFLDMTVTSYHNIM